MPVCQANLNLFAGSLTTIDGQNTTGPLIPFADNVVITIDHTKLNLINFQSTSYTVINTNTSMVSGSLKKAIASAEQTPVEDNILFSVSGMAPHTFDLTGYNPFLKFPITLDGSSQPDNGYTGPLPNIVFSGGTIYYTKGVDIYGVHFKGHSMDVRTLSNQSTIGKIGTQTVFTNGAGMIVSDVDDVQLSHIYFGMDNQNQIYSNPSNNLYPYIDIDRTKGTIISDCHFASGYHLRTQLDTNTQISNCTFGYHTNRNELISIASLELDHSENISIYNNSLRGLIVAAVNNSKISNNRFGVKLSDTTRLASVEIDIRQCSTIIFGGNRSLVESNSVSGGIFVYNCNDISILGNDIKGGRVSTSLQAIDSIYQGIECYYENTNIEIGRLGDDYENSISETQIAVCNYNSQSVSVRNNKFSKNSTSGMVNLRLIAPSNAGITSPVATSLTGNNIQGTAGANYLIDLYLRKEGDLTVEGFDYLTTVITDANGDWSYTAASPASERICDIVMMANDSESNTSEFSDVRNTCSVLSNQKAYKTSEIRVFPNPSTIGQVFIQFPTEVNSLNTVYNSRGERIEQYVISGDQLVIHTLGYKQGIYMLKLDSDKGSKSLTFVVQ